MHGNTGFIVQTNALAACFDDDINFKIIDAVADLQPLYVVFKDGSFRDDKDRINVEKRFKRLSPETKITVLSYGCEIDKKVVVSIWVHTTIMPKMDTRDCGEKKDIV